VNCNQPRAVIDALRAKEKRRMNKKRKGKTDAAIENANQVARHTHTHAKI
jgi:hypothetical protein